MTEYMHPLDIPILIYLRIEIQMKKFFSLLVLGKKGKKFFIEVFFILLI